MISLVKSFFQIVYTLLIIIFLISCDAILPDDNEIVIYSWAKTFGGTEGDTIFSVTTDKLGNIYCAGRFDGTADFNPEIGKSNITSNGSYDAFLTKINANGSYSWTITFGGPGNEAVSHVATDLLGNIFIAGQFEGTVDFNPGPEVENMDSLGDVDCFLTKINFDGSYAWTKIFGGTGYDPISGIKIDLSGNIYIAGSFDGIVDFDPGEEVDNKTSSGSFDCFLTKINSDGSYAWTKTFGGIDNDGVESIATDAHGNIYIAGIFTDTVDFDPGTGTDIRSSIDASDIFLSKINTDGAYSWTKIFGGIGNAGAFGIEIDKAGNIYISGGYSGATDFDPSTGTDIRPCIDGGDVYLTRINENGTYGWTMTFASLSSDNTTILQIDDICNIYIAGGFSGTVDFNPGTGVDSKTSCGSFTAFVTRISCNGTYCWTHTFSADGSAYIYSMDTINSKNIFIAGSFSGQADFDPSDKISICTSSGLSDCFLVKLIREP